MNLSFPLPRLLRGRGEGEEGKGRKEGRTTTSKQEAEAEAARHTTRGIEQYITVR